MKRRKLDRERLKAKPKLRKEWVSIDAGDVCVWEMNAAQMLSLAQRIERPGIDPRRGVDESAAAIWLLLFCTHLSDEEESPLVWTETQLSEIYGLSMQDFKKLSVAAQKVNGTDERSLQDLRDFTRATEAPSTSGSASSASSISIASPASLSTSPITS